MEGFDVEVREDGHFVLATVDGQAMPVPVAEYEAQLVDRLIEVAMSSLEFRARWVSRDDRRSLLDHLIAGGRSPKVVQLLREMQDYDLFDVLVQLGYGVKAKTRLARFGDFYRRQSDWFGNMPPKTALTIEAIAKQFIIAGTDGLEDTRLFEVPEVVRAGGLPALKLIGKPVDVLQETKIKLFEV